MFGTHTTARARYSWQTDQVIVVVAPGQGSQTPGFLEPWIAEPRFKEHLQRISDSVEIDLVKHGTTSDADTIRDTAIAQPLIVAAGLLALEGLVPDKGQAEDRRHRGPLRRRDHRIRRRRDPRRRRGAALRQTAQPGNGGCRKAGQDRHERRHRRRRGCPARAARRTRPRAGELQRRRPDRRRRRTPRAGEAQPRIRSQAPASSPCRSRARSTPTSWSRPSRPCTRSPHPSGRATPNCRFGQIATAPSIESGTTFVDLMVSQVTSPVRWDLTMASLAEAGVTGLIELAPAGSPGRAGQARTQGNPDGRDQDARRSRRGPRHDEWQLIR